MDKKNKVKRARKTKRIKRGKPMRRKTMRRKTMRRKTMRRKTMRRKTMRKSRMNKRYVGGSPNGERTVADVPLDQSIEVEGNTPQEGQISERDPERVPLIPFPEDIHDHRLAIVYRDYKIRLQNKGLNFDETRQIINIVFNMWKEDALISSRDDMKTILEFKNYLNGLVDVDEKTDLLREAINKKFSEVKDYVLLILKQRTQRGDIQQSDHNRILEQIRNRYPHDYDKWLKAAANWDPNPRSRAWNNI